MNLRAAIILSAQLLCSSSAWADVQRPTLSDAPPSPMLLGGATHANVSEHAGPLAPSLAWSASLASEHAFRDAGGSRQRIPPNIYASPIQGPRGELYTIALGGVLTSLSPDGDVLWRQPLRDRVVSTPALDAEGGRLFAATLSGRLFCIDAREGHILWIARLPAQVRSSPVIAGRRLYISAHNYTLAFTLDGALLWRFTVPSPRLNSTPAVAPDGTVYIGSWGGKLIAINPDGSLRWDYTFGAPRDIPEPCIDAAGRMYDIDSSNDERESALHGFTPNGERIFELPLRADSFVFPSLDRDGNVLLADRDGYVYSVNHRGEPVFILHFPGEAFQGSISTDRHGRLFLISRRGTLLTLSSTGLVLERLQLPGGAVSTPLIGRETHGRARLYVGTQPNILLALEGRPW